MNPVLLLAAVAAMTLTALPSAAQSPTAVTARPDRSKLAYIVPLDVARVALVQQPDFPVRIQEAELFVRAAGDWGIRAQLRCGGQRVIRSCSIGWIGTSGTNGFFDLNLASSANPIDCAESAVVLAANELELVDAPAEVAAELRRLRVLELITVMVVRVEFEDGTVADSMPAYSKLMEGAFQSFRSIK